MRRRRDLVHALIEACGGKDAVSEFRMLAIRRAGELLAAAEQARAAVLTNGAASAADWDALVKIEGESRRAVRGLGLKDAAGAKPHVPMREQLAAELEAEAAEEADEDEAQA